MNSFDEVFAKVKRYCTENELISDVAMKTWIDTMTPVGMEGNEAIFMVQTEFQQGVVLNHHKKVLETALEQVMGFPMELVIHFKNREEARLPKSVTTTDMVELEEKHEELRKSYEFAEYDYTFDTFIVGRSNEFAYAACKAVATDAASTYNPLFIYGPSGLGKTHLVTAIKHEILTREPDKNVIYVTGESFGNELIKAIDQRDTSVFHDKYRNADVLIVDDIQFFSGKERMQEEFFHTFNKLHSEGKQIVITSDKPPRDLKTLEERIRNRFEWGLIADISTPDFETRFAIIRRKAELLDLKIPDEVTEFIANRLKTNIRQLEGAVKKLKALKMLANSSPTISMAQSVIRDILTDDQPIPITVEKVIAEVANVYGITAEDIRSSKRTSQISTARKVAAYVVREVTGMPLAAIGMEFGGRDHSTIVYAINNVTEALKKDANLKELVEDIIKDIRDKNPNPPIAM
ncbi:MAG: chromosomal replication initiator protein DnaA [Ruminococcus sp.]|nr:chromosomal replication initiator protein DnaA [Ruminococcus sp.]MBQ7003421.1 chromosomal replication initiator protein DnaA [Oscillospiraceae bacterium]